jgi:hypothetical protein
VFTTKKNTMSFKIKLIVSLIVVFYQYSIAQQGAPFITNFYTENESLNENFSIAEDKDGVIIIANRRGILTFDAEEWHLIKTPEIPLTVALNPIGGQVFVGCRNSAGLLVKNQTGDYEFQSLKSTTTGVVTQILFTTGLAYIISSEFITSVNLKTLAIESQIEADKDKAFLVAFVNNNKLFVDYQQLGLMTIESQELKQIKTKFDLSGRLTFTAKFDANTTLLGASDNKLYVFDGKKIQLYKVQDQQYLSDGGLSDARIIDSTKIAIATASAGCLVIEKQTGKTLFTINYQIGLPDDEVLALGTDRNHGIWISHNYGLSRIDGDIPVKNFSTYKGLTGNLQSAGMVNNRLYVTTGNGVYYLDKKKDYVEYTVKSNIETVDLKPVAQPTQ